MLVEQCDVVSIYTMTNTQRIRIYPGKLKLILVKISSDPGHILLRDTKPSHSALRDLGL